ncbi:transcription factor GTE6-like [Rutidosis leptorrhynchoides]|uniref:transcription factor GTE6-like n=1 Tax=Rutidosis leptorrhynchoides TaxID=125765 RepID=UPI003A9A196D
METADAPVPEVRTEGEPKFVEELGQNVDEINIKVDELEKRLNEVQQFYSKANKKHSNTSKASSILKDKDKDKQLTSFKRRQQDASRREAAAAKRMQDLMRQLAALLRQHIMGHKWSGPFMQPVDVVGLGLHDYYEIIEKPMDFSTIKAKMEAKDGTGYKNVREICADVRLIFKNAMKYNDDRNDVHVMAKTLLAKFEEKWLQLLPKVDEEDERLKQEEADAQFDIQLAQEVMHAKMAKDLQTEFAVVDRNLEELREVVLRNCRKISTEEKKTLMTVLTQLSPEDLNKALLIVGQNNPDFQADDQEVDLDIDAQSESTLWKLKFFVKDLIQSRGKSPTSIGGNTNTTVNTNVNQNKRKKETNGALGKPPQKRTKKAS